DLLHRSFAASSLAASHWLTVFPSTRADRRDPRDLPSFPTRRSSDLPVRSSIWKAWRRTEFSTRHGAGAVSARRRQRCRRPRAPSDRKSTRLNSSHVKISYAVLCLKKNKKKPFFQSSSTSRIPITTYV